LDNIGAVTVHCWNGLLLTAGLLVGALAYRAWVMDPAARIHWNKMHRQELAILALWVVPMVLFGTTIGFTSQPGYVIGYLPALLVLGGAAVGTLRRRWLAVVLTALVTMVNVWVFTGWPVSGDGVLLGARPTAQAIREHDRQLARAVTAIRRHCAPDRVVILHALAAHYRFGLRFFQLYLPEFEQVQLQPDPTVLCPPDAPLLGVRGGQTVCVPPGGWRAVRDLVLIVPPPLAVSVFKHWLDPALAQPLPGTDGMVWVVSEAAGNDHPHLGGAWGPGTAAPIGSGPSPQSGPGKREGRRPRRP